jgi:hypothetical protein
VKFNDCGFDLNAPLSQQQPDPEPIPAPVWSAVQEQPIEQSFIPLPNPVQTELAPLAPEPCDVQFGQHFTLLQPLYTPFSQSEPWKLPRWVIATVGVFFGSAAVFAIATCVVLLRDPKPAPTEPAPVAMTAPVAVAAPVAAPSLAPAPHIASPPKVTKAPTVHAAALPHRVVVSRHPSFVRRQIHGPRRVASRSTSSSIAAEETETVSRRPPQDALDKLLGESSLAGAP